LLNNNDRIAFDHLGLHLLLLVAFQVASILCFLAHSLYGRHHIALLRKKCIAKVSRPLNVIRQPLHHIG
jgi:ABC-type siderophore export system fused ATPase/permease subunit